MKYLIAVLMLTSAVAWSQPGFDDTEFGPLGSERPRMMERLNLTGEQEQKVDLLTAEFQKKQIATRAQLQSLRIDLRQLFKAEKPERSKVESKMKDIEKLTADLRLAHVDHWFDVYALLTPEQQKVWKERPRMGGRGMERGRMMMKHRMAPGRDDEAAPRRGRDND